MRFDILSKVIEIHDIPKNVELKSDSGWECGATKMDGVYYNAKKNQIVFTQFLHTSDTYYEDPDWTPIYGEFWGFDVKNVDPKILEHLKDVDAAIGGSL